MSMKEESFVVRPRTAKMTPTEASCLSVIRRDGELNKIAYGGWVGHKGLFNRPFSTQTVQRLVQRGLVKIVDGRKAVLVGSDPEPVKFPGGWSDTFFIVVTNGERLPGVPSPQAYAILNAGGTKELVRSVSSLIWGTASKLAHAEEMAARIPADGHPVSIYECRRIK